MHGLTYTNRHQSQVRYLLPDLVRHRRLLFDLVSKDLRVRYRFTALGFLWAVLEPLMMTLILYFVFGYVFQIQRGAGDTPFYAVSLLCGLVFWQFLSRSLTAGVRSLVDHENLVSKVHFPRELVPLSVMGTNLVHLIIGVAILVVLFVASGGRPGASALWMLPALLIQMSLVTGLLLLLSCLHVFYRDVGYIVDVVMVMGFYASPIFYSYETHVQPALAGHPWALALYGANPMVGLLTVYRQALVVGRTPDPYLLLWPALLAILALGGGAWLFRRKSGVLADYL